MCICINSGTKECNAHIFFPRDRKEGEKLTFSAATVVTDSRSCTVATSSTVSFFYFFSPTTKTLQADTATIEIKEQNNVVWGVGMRRKKKKVMTKKIQMPTLLISLSTLNHMTSSGKPTSYTCKRAHLISFRRWNTRQTHSACHQSTIPRLAFLLPKRSRFVSSLV